LVDKGYVMYCRVDPLFYDSPTRIQDESDPELGPDTVPEGWTREDVDDWRTYLPDDVKLPPQGWKIHASACLDNAADILAAVCGYCLPRRIAFKFIRTRRLLFLRNAKYANRSSSGKFITIYPQDEAQLEVVLTELGALLDGRPGPYILSDLRWGAGPLHVRYGGFADRYCVGAGGEPEPAIAGPDGTLVPDRRGATFQIPPWVTLPRCLTPHLEARNGTTIADLPYQIERALHFSNGGGLYAGTDKRTQERVVLKEARPHAALAMDEADAVTRLRHERDIMARLAGVAAVPALRDYFTVGEHEFLVEDFVEGSTLTSLLAQRYPLMCLHTDEAAAAEYTDWALNAYYGAERAVEAVHERGVVIGDLHPSNMILRPDGRLVLIDLECATLADAQRRPVLAAPAFAPPAGCSGIDVDRYALASLRLYLFLPLTALHVLDRGKAEQFAAAIAEMFPVPSAFLTDAVQVITGARRRAGARNGRPPAPEPDAADWPRARASIAAAILASATPRRDDRLFPGDVRQFWSGGLNLAYGAAGVLYALDATGAGRHPDHEEWLVQRATERRSGTRPGFYDGLHGVAYALDRLGRRDDALKVLDICADEFGERKWEQFGLDLASGLAGIGLNLAYFAEALADSGLRDAAWRAADVIAARLGDEQSVPAISGGKHPYAGLLRGSSGPALLFLRLYEDSGDGALLDLAATALRQDLRRCVTASDGELHVDEGWRTMPYIADGAVGIGFALDDYLGYREDERFAEAAGKIRRAARAQFYAQPGVFYGRAGMILYLSRGYPPGTAAARDDGVAAHVRRLAWHALSYRGHLAFPGDQLLRLSMDLATGSAGVMLALGAALHEQPVCLPFLAARRADRLGDGNHLDPLLATEGR
jgi:tRNA A-37 threonylcarbamoyl transferase component Bud32